MSRHEVHSMNTHPL